MPAADTKTTILDAAERLFAATGFQATTMRALTAAAGVNLAAVGYHFGGKEELAMAVLARRIAPINAERRRRLDALAARPTTTAVVRAFLEPVFGIGDAGRGAPPPPDARFCGLFGRLLGEQPPFLRTFLARQFRDLGQRFARALRRSLPGLDEATAWWRLHFVAGAMAHVLQHAETLAHVTDGVCRVDEPGPLAEQLVAFAAAGLAAPPPSRRRVRRTRP